MTRRAGAGAVVAASLGYVIWRVIATVPHRPSWAALYMWAVLAAEVGLVWHYSWLVWLLRTFRDRTIEVAHHRRWYEAERRVGPHVAILIPTYDEGPPVLLRAIAGAVRQDHSSFEVCVLDDGARPWVAEMCARQGVRYFARDERRGAKAGNLNAALRALMDEGRAGGPEFIGVLDADFVAQPGFLADTLALMHDRRVGLVQTPQYFYNPDPLQYAFPGAQLPDELRFAFDVSQPARDAAGEAYCCGTGFLARMEALRAIGLFPEDSVTEDVLTTARLREAGWRTVYLGQPLAFGLAAEDLKEFVAQRLRWFVGYLQVAREIWRAPSKDGVLTRLRRMEMITRWGHTSACRLGLALVPPLYWGAGLQPFQARSSTFLCLWSLLLVLQQGFLARASRGRYVPLLTEAHFFIMAPQLTSVWLKALWKGPAGRFVVTRKGLSRPRTSVFWPSFRWVLGLGLINLAALVHGARSASRGLSSRPLDAALLVLAALMVVVLLVAAVVCVERPRYRSAERVETDEPAILRRQGVSHPIRLRDLSEGGALVRGGPDRRALSGPGLVLSLEGMPEIPARVVRHAADGGVGLELVTTEDVQKLLIQRIYSPAYLKVGGGSLFQLVSGLGRRLLGAVRSGPRARRKVPSLPDPVM